MRRASRSSPPSCVAVAVACAARAVVPPTARLAPRVRPYVVASRSRLGHPGVPIDAEIDVERRRSSADCSDRRCRARRGGSGGWSSRAPTATSSCGSRQAGLVDVSVDEHRVRQVAAGCARGDRRRCGRRDRAADARGDARGRRRRGLLGRHPRPRRGRPAIDAARRTHPARAADDRATPRAARAHRARGRCRRCSASSHAAGRRRRRARHRAAQPRARVAARPTPSARSPRRHPEPSAARDLRAVRDRGRARRRPRGRPARARRRTCARRGAKPCASRRCSGGPRCCCRRSASSPRSCCCSSPRRCRRSCSGITRNLKREGTRCCSTCTHRLATGAAVGAGLATAELLGNAALGVARARDHLGRAPGARPRHRVVDPHAGDGLSSRKERHERGFATCSTCSRSASRSCCSCSLPTCSSISTRRGRTGRARRGHARRGRGRCVTGCVQHARGRALDGLAEGPIGRDVEVRCTYRDDERARDGRRALAIVAAVARTRLGASRCAPSPRASNERATTRGFVAIEFLLGDRAAVASGRACSSRRCRSGRNASTRRRSPPTRPRQWSRRVARRRHRTRDRCRRTPSRDLRRPAARRADRGLAAAGPRRGCSPSRDDSHAHGRGAAARGRGVVVVDRDRRAGSTTTAADDTRRTRARRRCGSSACA